MDLETSKAVSPKLPRSASTSAVSRDEASLPETVAASERLTRIKSEEAGVELNLGELWQYRELLYFLTLRDIKVRYKQTVMGVAWVIIQPLLTVLIFTLVFNRFVRFDTGPLPYPLFALSGLLLWLFFANAVTNCTNSLLSNSNLITKVYFPRLFIPTASVGAGLVDLGVAFLLLITVCIYYGLALKLTLLLVPFLILLMALLALGVGLLSAAMTVKYRDLRHALPFIIQLWMFASPVIYPASLVPAKWKWLLLVNPVAGIIEGFRAALTGRPFDYLHLSISAAITFGLLLFSVYVFRRFEDTFADVV
ncbi:MAG TPA: ABC transporter permease [Pyrinomonadaceae bacterium]|jgi:lipopolysaccharide transport system permease protein|nr:ABC transporter permease [Pyrinomonadaceae bacterium]